MSFHIWTFFFLVSSVPTTLILTAPENYLIENMSTVQESIVCVTYSRYKSNIDNLIKTVLPILDAEGYAICPDCDSRVNCGTIGLANLEKCHRGKKICKAVQQKRDKEVKKKKDGNILSFLKPKAASVPSTVDSSAPVHGYKLATHSNSATDTIPTASTIAM